MTQALARKWRPRTFTEMVGQEHVVRALTNALSSARLHHAYLFTGTRGVGKTTLARIIAKALNCETGVTDSPCGKCSACMEIDAGRFVDLIELDAASNTQVDNMRELLENAMYAPTAGRYKVYIIDEVHMLSRNAFNAMLKTLEEPPEHVKFVLATTDPQKIPVTVLSRCLQFNLKQIPQTQIQTRLQQILAAEGLAAETPALALIARAAQGSLRDALSLLDQAIAHGGGKVELTGTRTMLGAVDQTYLHTLLRALASRDGGALIAEADRMAERSLSFEMALQDLGTLLHRLALVQIVPQVLGEEEPDAEVLRELAALFEAEELQLYYQISVQGRSEIGLAPDEYAGFTMTLLRMLAFAPSSAPTRARSAPAVAAKERAPAVVAEERTRAAPAQDVSSPPVTTAESSSPPVTPAEDGAAITGAAWPQMIEELGLNGMARMLAQHCELVRLDANRADLTLPKAHERLLEKPYQDRLKGALQKQFGANLKVSIAIGEGNGNSPVAMATREREREQARAIAEIEQDPFVRELVEDMDARVSSIKPLQ
ncbi:MAG TPA: DNA polymerase III subunit gamma/tau [Burkholderiales bacterium]|nr:DNA polymerase III subunit gamma/tau [Burkholderiales bacterium]